MIMSTCIGTAPASPVHRAGAARLACALIAGLALAAPTQARTATPRPPADPPVEKIRPSKIILVGDSTIQPQSGWGSSFCGYRIVSTAACLNLARGGRSTKSYRAEGSWDVALGEMKTPGYVDIWVLIQFGHNDQPGKPGRSTDLATEFPANLRRYVAETRAAGAKPILVTPLTRRQFRDGSLIRELDPWNAAIRKVAAELDVPLVELNARSAAVIEAMGPAMATHYAQSAPTPDIVAAALTGTTSASDPSVPVPPAPPLPPLAAGAPPYTARVRPLFDYTHLNRDGADLFAGIVADELAIKVPAMRPLLVP
jgi:lysophospholipase L1-like esterase